MGFRTVIIKSRAKLEARLNYLVVRGEEERKVYLNEINTLIVQSTAVSLTAALLCELTKRNVKVIFCDEKCNPESELIPYYGSGQTVRRYREQFEWPQLLKQKIWKHIVQQKIREQAALLSALHFVEQAEMLNAYARQVQDDDVTNREGHAAKVYFNCLLGEDGSRRQGSFVNGCLNYGYAVILSAINREIVAAGYLTQIGIKHCNEFNEFNLGCDLMEIFRPYVDRLAVTTEEGDKQFKRRMASVLHLRMRIDNDNSTVDVGIKMFVKSFFRAMHHQDVAELSFPQWVEFEDEL